MFLTSSLGFTKHSSALPLLGHLISVYDITRSTRLRQDKQFAGKAYVALQLRSTNVRSRFSSMHPKHA
jgi:hypothetical protein